MCADMKVQKIKNRAQPNPVDNIAESAADNHAKPDPNNAHRFFMQPPQQRGDNKQCNQTERYGSRSAGITEHGKADPGVPRIYKVKKRREFYNRTFSQDIVQHHKFGQLINEQDIQSNNNSQNQILLLQNI